MRVRFSIALEPPILLRADIWSLHRWGLIRAFLALVAGLNRLRSIEREEAVVGLLVNVTARIVMAITPQVNP